MSDEEFLANLKNIGNEKLIQSLQSCGHDGYYNDLYYPIIEEIKRRLSSTSAASERTAKVDRYTIFPVKVCDICHSTVDYPDKYCSECGAKLDWSDDEYV